MHIDPSHPRAVSLLIREKLVWGVKKGFTSTAGLLAHGRGEAFDYLLEEKTHDFAHAAVKAAAAYLLLARKPIISTNGNSSALSANSFIKLAKIINCRIEVNLFHYSRKRQEAIEKYFNHLSPGIVLKSNKAKKIIIPNIFSHRKIALENGISGSDVVFIPLEDGDRCTALKSLGKKVIAIDLNPLSRTSQTATVTIIDNIIRAMPDLISCVKTFKKQPEKNLKEIVKQYQNQLVLHKAIKSINKHLEKIAGLPKQC